MLWHRLKKRNEYKRFFKKLQIKRFFFIRQVISTAKSAVCVRMSGVFISEIICTPLGKISKEGSLSNQNRMKPHNTLERTKSVRSSIHF
jgi:hypothetical protein